MILSNAEGLALLAFVGRSPLRDEDYAPAMNIAKRGLVVWTVLPFAIIPQVTPEGRAAAIAFLDDESVARELGLLDECPRTLRSGEYPAPTAAAIEASRAPMPRFPTPLPSIQTTWHHVAENSSPESRAAETVRPMAVAV